MEAAETSTSREVNRMRVEYRTESGDPVARHARLVGVEADDGVVVRSGP
jgi:hypothetical protein